MHACVCVIEVRQFGKINKILHYIIIGFNKKMDSTFSKKYLSRRDIRNLPLLSLFSDSIFFLSLSFPVCHYFLGSARGRNHRLNAISKQVTVRSVSATHTVDLGCVYGVCVCVYSNSASPTVEKLKIVKPRVAFKYAISEIIKKKYRSEADILQFYDIESTAQSYSVVYCKF